VGQGFNGGLQPLAELYGVDVAADETPVPKPIVPPVNLSKISLTISAQS
jgi:tellurite resistance protein TerA